ncbi:hypothetical protein OJ996_00035 [Luteolibacter sp. GHJ8]|uniref:Outer membrane transport energization protein TonB n=1 Tax=Luteolibacter rhizosphaerae TaxID=2989719 RepID=A0ABT3FWG3_9BACT|nr:hypothetical protein [Luteolibacter rhizosphaerae]MCW1911940.1 hypothetical protein [Luteolibacter rhizosphaerae]
MKAEDFESEGRTKRRVIGAAVAALLIGGLVAFFTIDHKPGPVKPKAKEMVVVSIPPPPPPPPPAPPPPPEPPQEPEQQEEMVEEEAVVDESPEPPSPAEPPALGTGLTGDGPNSFGLGTAGDGGGKGGPGGGGPAGTRFRSYGKSIEGTVLAAFRSNAKLRKASLRGTLLVWVDRSTGRTVRAKLINSNASSELIEEARRAAMDLQIPGSAPADMPLPVRLQINIRSPR